MKKERKNFLVSTADFAYYINDELVCTGTTNLNTSFEVSMEEQKVNAGKGGKKVFSYKYGRELAVTLETANWELAYIAANVGSSIFEGLADVYKIEECVELVNGIGTLEQIPVGDVFVKTDNGTIITVQAVGSAIDLSANNIMTGTVKATYQYNTITKSIAIDSESAPAVGKLVLDADKFSNDLGKVGTVQIIIPSYQLSGNFNIEFTPDGVTSTNLDGSALAASGEKCSDGSSVYATIHEWDTKGSDIVAVNDIAATPSELSLSIGDSIKLSVIGLKGSMYAPIKLDNSLCSFSSDDTNIAVVDSDGVITAAANGTTLIHISYNGHNDVLNVTVS